MSRLNLIIADPDETYLNGVINYITEKYQGRFKIQSFSDKKSFQTFVENCLDKLDIVLVSPNMFYDGLKAKKITLLALLSSGRIQDEYSGMEAVFKYQLGDNLVKNILNLYSDRSTEIIVNKGNMDTRIVAVFSCCGSGKTSIAYGCSAKSSLMGLKTFYLNLEESSSTALFFENNVQYNLSHIFYYLKSKNKSLALKIEGIRMVDTLSGIDYFASPKSQLELFDVDPSEYRYLLSEMRAMNYYKNIYIDLPSFLDKRIIAVLDEVDEIYFVLTPDYITKIKLENTLNEFAVISRNENIELLSKTVFIMNKVTQESEIDLDVLNKYGATVAYSLPFVEELYIRQNDKIIINLNNRFGQKIDELVKRGENL